MTSGGWSPLTFFDITFVGVGESLVIRLEQPLTSDGDCPHPNEATKSSLAFLRGRLAELRDASKELDASLPQQVSCCLLPPL